MIREISIPTSHYANIFPPPKTHEKQAFAGNYQKRIRKRQMLLVFRHMINNEKGRGEYNKR